MTTNIVTYTGRSIDPLSKNIQPEDIDILDIATALSRIPRFGGHTRYLYSVAQHSCMVADRLRPGLKLAGLLHDASEAYLLDIPTPIKQHLPNYYTAERRLQIVIQSRFGLAVPPYNQEAFELYNEVKRADQKQLQYEIEMLMNVPYSDTWKPQYANPLFRCWYPDEAAHHLLDMFNELYSGL